MRLVLFVPLMAACSLITDPGSYEGGGDRDGGTDTGVDGGACADVICPPGEICDPATGGCIADGLCDEIVCAPGELCNPVDGLCVECLVDDDCAVGTCVANECFTGGESPCCAFGDCQIFEGIEVTPMGVTETGSVDDGGAAPVGFNRIQVAPAPEPNTDWIVARRQPPGSGPGEDYLITPVSDAGVARMQESARILLPALSGCDIPVGALVDLHLRGDGEAIGVASLIGVAGMRVVLSRGGYGVCDVSMPMDLRAEGHLTQAFLDGQHTVLGDFADTSVGTTRSIQTHPVVAGIDGSAPMGTPIGSDGGFDAVVWTSDNMRTDDAYVLYDDTGRLLEGSVFGNIDGPVRMLGGGDFFLIAGVTDNFAFVDTVEENGGTWDITGTIVGLDEVSSGQIGLVELESGRLATFTTVMSVDGDIVLGLPAGDFSTFETVGRQMMGTVDEMDVAWRERDANWIEVVAAVRSGRDSRLARWYVCGAE